MWNLIYEYSFSFSVLAGNLTFIAVGIGFFFSSSFFAEDDRNNVAYYFFLIVGKVVGPLLLILGIITVPDIFSEHFYLRECLETKDYLVVEGFVEDYHPMPASGHDRERFSIDGIDFEYTNFSDHVGYNLPASHGGAVKENGQHLRICYLTEDNFDELYYNPVIIKLEEYVE